jgi:hypothetical protein
VKILATSNPDLLQKVLDYKANMAETSRRKNDKLEY